MRKKIACVVERPTSADGRRGDETDGEAVKKIESLESKNTELREKLGRVEDEKASLVQQERERIQHLAQEFDNVRKELDQEMCRYESEKKWLKSRIQNLEKDNQELQKQIEEGKNTPLEKKKLPIIAVLDEDKGLMRKTLSEPELSYEDDEVNHLRAENERLKGLDSLNCYFNFANLRELDRVRESLRRTASAASAASRRSNRSQLSPAFGALADDLNMVNSLRLCLYVASLSQVKSDLEQILSQIDEEAPKSITTASTSRGPTPAEEEQLQSVSL